jgi:PAS domain S-box-containing protein
VILRIRPFAIYISFLSISLFFAFFLFAPHIALSQTNENRTLIVRGDHDYPPYEFLQDGKPKGFNIDLINETARVMNLKVNIQLGPWNKVRGDLENKNIDILSGVAHSIARDKLFDFALPHVLISFDFFVRKGSSIRSLRDLKGKEIIVQEGGIMYDYLKEQRLTEHIITGANSSDIIKLLADGKHDAILMNKIQGLYFIRTLELSNVEALGIENLPRTKYGFAVAGGNSELRATLDEGLQILKNTGKYNEIYEKWFGIYENKNSLQETRGRIFLISLFVIVLLFLGILVWTWSLRKQVKSRTAALEMSEERYRLLVENASEGVIVVTGEEVAFINPRALQILGCTEERLNTKMLFNIIHPDDQNIVLDFYFNTLKKEDVVVQYPFRIITRKDEPEWVLNNSVKIEWEKKTGVLNIFTDITESKKLEQQLLQAQKMEAIGQFAGGIAHDFNNILTAIMGYGNLLKMKIKGEEPLIRYIDNILTAAEKAANLTKSLLTFTRKQVIDPKPTDINEAILNAEKLLSKLIGEDVDFSVKLSGNNLIVIADGNQIIQVLMNLATNARDAMPRGGKLTIRTDIVEIDDTFIHMHGYGKKGLYALISFEDTGMGMTDKTMERMFEPFFTTKEVGKGTGLGLATVYGIIKQQNGYIDVRSVLNEGTTFNIYLPIVLSTLEENKPIRTSHVAGGNETILVGEDEEDIRNFIREVLEGYGYKIIEAIDGEDVIRKFKENKNAVQLLILDIIMPKKNGKDAYKEIDNGNGNNTKVIFISGHTADFIQNYAGSDEEINFLYKPIDINTLLGEVRRVLDEK